jgi:hypothetical protein
VTLTTGIVDSVPSMSHEEAGDVVAQDDAGRAGRLALNAFR